jgi:hypothetical protein
LGGYLIADCRPEDAAVRITGPRPGTA